MARGRSSKVWVRNPSQSLTVIGTSTDTAAVQSLRENSIVTTAVSTTLQVGLPNEFTVVRFLAWAQLTADDSGAGLVSNYPAGIIGVRVASKEEIEEMAGDAGFRSETGPVGDVNGEWMLWGLVYAANGGFTTGAQEVQVGKEMFDIRSARRVDGLTEDVVISLQMPVSALTTTTRSLRVSWAALCVLP